MGHGHESFQTIRTQMMTSGVNSAFAKLNTDETKMTSTGNSTVGNRGTLRAKHLMVQQGSDFIQATDPDGSNSEEVSPVLVIDQSWEVESIVASGTSVDILSHGLLNIYGADNDAASVGHYKVRRPIVGGEHYNTKVGYDLSASFGLDIKSNSMFPIPISTAASPGLFVDFAVAEDKLFSFGFSSTGISVRANATVYNAIASTDNLFSGTARRVEFRIGDQGSEYRLDTYIDGVLVDSNKSVAYTAALSTSDQFVDVTVRNASSMPADYLVSGYLTNFFVRDTSTNPTEVPALTAAYSRSVIRKTSGAVQYYRYATTSRALWLDRGFDGLWRPTLPLNHATSFMSDFRDDTILCNSGDQEITDLFRLDPSGGVTVLDDAPNIRFAEAHNNRLWGAGNRKYKLRLYFSGDRAPNKWFSPETDADGQETYDEVLSAGYFEIDGKSGDEIRCIWGNYLGAAIVATNRKLFRITGTDIADWRVEELSDHVGALSPNSMARVGNDLFILGETGIASLNAIQGYGDLATQRMTKEIQDLFTRTGNTRSVLDPNSFSLANMVYDETSSVLTVGLNGTTLYEFKLDTGQWFGPLDQDNTAMTIGYNGFPLYTTLLMGTSDGKFLAKTDRSEHTGSIKVESALLNGRSVDPKMVSMVKAWKFMRILCNPIGDFDLYVRYKTDEEDWITETCKLIVPDEHVLGVDWEVSVSPVGDTDNFHIMNVTLDTRGKSFKYELLTDAPAISLLGVETEFTLDGYEED